MNISKKHTHCCLNLIKVTYSIKYWKHGNFGIPSLSKIDQTEPDHRDFFNGPDETVYLPVRKTMTNKGKYIYRVDLPNKSSKYFKTIESIMDDHSQLDCQIVNDHKYINLDMDHYDQIITYKFFTTMSVG